MRVLRLVARWQVSACGAQNALRRQEGQTMAEYGVVLAVITLVVVVALTTLSTNIRDGITGIAALIPG
jgi:Flp pilus assembly pilin Flp